MSWRYVQRFVTTPSGVSLPHDLLVNEDGVEIRLALSKGWTLEYRRPDLTLRFFVGGLDQSVSRREIEVLGPKCSVKMIANSNSRPLRQEEFPIIARDVRGALENHLALPWARPPAIIGVCFCDARLAPFSDVTSE